MLSLVTKSLVIVNKENVIGFIGWIIMNWRSLFSKGDYIHILNYKGFVTEIRFIHFRIYETIEHGDKKLLEINQNPKFNSDYKSSIYIY
jgi:hypothetical protein